MSEIREKIRRWRDKAKQVRNACQSFHAGANRQVMLNVADTYERLADEAEARLMKARKGAGNENSD